MNKTITVYKLLEASELVAQKKSISKLLIGGNLNPSGNNLISFNMDDKLGFFSMKNSINDHSKTLPVNVPKTEAIAIQKAGELLNEYNNKLSDHPTLSNLFKGLKASHANSVMHEKGYGIKQWDVYYQVYVKNEENSKNGSKPVNGMSVTVKIANHGKLIGMDYNMRPIKENIQSRRYNVNIETQGEIEPETELLYMSSLSQGVIAPFYNTLSYKSAPACVEAENMLSTSSSSSISQATPKSNSIKTGEPGINLNKLVWRIGSEDSTPFFELTDESGLAIKYEKEEKDYDGNDLKGSIILPEGAKVIQLKPSEKNENLIRTIAFWNGKYRDAFLNKKAFEKNMINEDFGGVDVFFNDLAHDIYRAKEYVSLFPSIIEKSSIILSKSQKLFDQFKQDENKTAFISKITNNQNKFQSKLNENNIEAVENILNLFGKILGFGKVSEKLLFIPINKIWFSQNQELKDYLLYNNHKEKSKIYGYYSDLTGSSASTNPCDTAEGKTFISQMKDFKKLLTTFPRDSQIKNINDWVLEFDDQNYKTKSNLLVSDLTYDSFIQNPEQASKSTTYINFLEDIGIFCTYGTLNIIPLIVVLVHELNVGVITQYYFTSETHTYKSTFSITANELWNGNQIISKIVVDSVGYENLSLDAIFQSNALTSLLSLQIINEYE